MTTFGLILLFIGFLGAAGCSLCRETAIQQADKYAAMGYQTRIATYDLKMDGLLYGAFIHSYHAQAQVHKDGKWLYVGMTGLSEDSTFRTGRMLILWDIETYRKEVSHAH
jgi:hypothetical protein